MATDTKCPLCGSETVIKTSKKGPNAGQSFHVCLRYPECKGKVPVGEQVDYDMPLVEPEETVSVEIITGDTPTQVVVSSAEMQEYETIKPFVSAYERKNITVDIMV